MHNGGNDALCETNDRKVEVGDGRRVVCALLQRTLPKHHRQKAPSCPALFCRCTVRRIANTIVLFWLAEIENYVFPTDEVPATVKRYAGIESYTKVE